MYKNLYASADSNVKKINFDLRNKVSQRIRNSSDVHIDYRRTAVGQKAVSVSGTKLWNLIPIKFSLVGKRLLVLGLISPSRTEFSFVYL